MSALEVYFSCVITTAWPGAIRSAKWVPTGGTAHVGLGRNAVFDFVANWTVVAGAMIGVWRRGVRGARGSGVSGVEREGGRGGGKY